jgi:hypothetical protein
MAKKLYRAEFSTKTKVGKPLKREDIDSFKNNFSKASGELDHLKLYLPQINEEENPDLLPVAFDSSIVNLVNGNDDAILTKGALALAKSIPYKFINVEHNRSYVVGVISSFGFASLDEKKELTEESLIDYSDPFYLCMGGMIWKSVDQYLGQMLEESDDEDSDMYQEFSTSWELGFDNYSLALGSKKLKDAEIITDAEQIKEMSKHLRCHGGEGILNDGTPIYRVVSDENPIFYGVGITSNPAAAVRGILTASKINFNKNDKIISQPINLSVIRTSMTLKDISDITDESITQITASSVRDFIKDQIRNKDQELNTQAEAALKEKNRLETEVESFKTQASTLERTQEQLNAEIARLQSELSDIKASQEAADKAEKFNLRMQLVADEFDLDDEVRTIIASEIKDLDDAGFDSWKNKFNILAIGFKKKAAAVQQVTNEEAAQTIIASAQVNSNIPNASATTDDMGSRFKKAFKIEVTKNKITL